MKAKKIKYLIQVRMLLIGGLLIGLIGLLLLWPVLSFYIFSQNTLVTITSSGGLCAKGSCDTTRKLMKDGTLLVNGNIERKITQQEVITLWNDMNATSFTEVRSHPFSGMCPTAYDGQEFTYIFHTLHGDEKLSSCIVDIDEQSRLFSDLSEVVFPKMPL